MTLRRVAVVVGTLAFVFAGRVAAQAPATGNLPTFDTAPPAPPPGAVPPGSSAGPLGGGQEPPCFNNFLPLREAAEKRAGAIKRAAEHKAAREQVCQLFKDFAVAEGKVVQFVTDNQTACQIPPQAISQMKANHDRTLKTRDRICASGLLGPGQPAGTGPAPAAGTNAAGRPAA